jgi:hypothetical protein
MIGALRACGTGRKRQCDRTENESFTHHHFSLVAFVLCGRNRPHNVNSTARQQVRFKTNGRNYTIGYQTTPLANDAPLLN